MAEETLELQNNCILIQIYCSNVTKNMKNRDKKMKTISNYHGYMLHLTFCCNCNCQESMTIKGCRVSYLSMTKKFV